LKNISTSIRCLARHILHEHREMSTPRAGYGPVGFSPLDDEPTSYRSPASYAHPFPPYVPDDGDIAAAYEMRDRQADALKHKQSENTVYSSTIFPSTGQTRLSLLSIYLLDKLTVRRIR
jgi:hypothetical protein